MKRILSIVLAMLILLSFGPISVSGAEESYTDITTQLNVDRSVWQNTKLGTDYSAVTGDGWYSNSLNGTHPITYQVKETGMQTIKFDWSVNQGSFYYGRYVLKFYINDTWVLSRKFDYEVNPCGNILSDVFQGRLCAGDTLKWEIEQTVVSWPGTDGRIYYLGNVKMSTKPDPAPKQRKISLPDSVENGTFMAYKNGNELKNGDAVFVGDKLNFVSTPDYGYGVFSGTDTGEKVLEDVDFSSEDIMTKLAYPKNDWQSQNPGEGIDSAFNNIKGNGLYHKVQHTMTYTATNPSTGAYYDNLYWVYTKRVVCFPSKTGKQKIKFDWGVNPSTNYNGSYSVKFYINDKCVISHDLTQRSDSYSGLLSDIYEYTANSNDILYWEFQKSNICCTDSYANKSILPCGDIYYIGNVEMTGGSTYKPEVPVFKPAKKIDMLDEVQNGTFTAYKNGNELKNGDTVFVGDKLNFVSTPDDGYGVFSGTDTGEKTLVDEDFSKDVTADLSADSSVWQTEKIGNNYSAVTGNGYYYKSPNVDKDTQTITFKPNVIGEQKITFDWSVDQGSISNGSFALGFFVNDELVKSHYFVYTANPYGNILSETYEYTANKDDVLKWQFVGNATGFSNSLDRVFYLGNVNAKTDTYKLEPPVFKLKKNIYLPDKVENGTFKVYKNGKILNKYDTVYVGDTLEFASIPDNGYSLCSGTDTGEKTLTEDDFVYRLYDVTDRIHPDSDIWQTEKISGDYSAVKGKGFYHASPRSDSETQTITYQPKKTGKQKVTFDWSVNQGYLYFGEFILNFYVNDKCVKTRYFTDVANPYGNIISETYEYNANKDDTLKWEFKRTSKGNWQDESGRVFYLGNVNTTEDFYKPETPVFKATKTIVLPDEVQNGIFKVYRNGVELKNGDTVLGGDVLSFESIPAEGYDFYSGTDTGEKTLSSSDFYMGNLNIEGNTYEPAPPIFKVQQKAVISGEAENGTFQANLNGNELKDGDILSLGDKLSFVSTPNEGYDLYSGTDTGEKILSADDLENDVTTDLDANTAIWQTDTIGGSYDAVTGNGFYHVSPRSDSETQTITYKPYKTGKQWIKFDWSVDQGFTTYGTYILNFYINDVCIKTHDFTQTANPYGKILTDAYEYTANENDILKWEFLRTSSGSKTESADRVFYLGNVKMAGDTYEVKAPVFKFPQTIVLPDIVNNGTFKAYKDGNELKTNDTVYIGDELRFISTPNDGYAYSWGTNTGKKTLVDEDFSKDVTTELNADLNLWKTEKLSDKYSDVTGNGYYNKLQDTYGSSGTQTITYKPNKAGKQKVTFDWSLSRGIQNNYPFVLKFYVNDECVINHPFNILSNRTDKIFSEVYEYTANKDDVLKWEFIGSTDAAEYDIVYYLGNVRIEGNTYAPDAPIFNPLRTITVDNSAANGSISVEETEAALENTVTVWTDPDKDYYAKQVKITDSENNITYAKQIGYYKYTFTMPDSDVTVSAEFAKATIDISTKDEFLNFISFATLNPNVNGNLTADIDLEGAEISPICPSSDYVQEGTDITEQGYTGTFNGNSHKISNFKIVQGENDTTVGLFGTVSGIIRDVVIDNALFDEPRGDGCYSALCGQLLPKGMISRCFVVNSNVNADGEYIGGALVGSNYDGVIMDSASINNEINSKGKAGSLEGEFKGDDSGLMTSLYNCYSTGTLIGGYEGTFENSQGNVSDTYKMAYLLNTINGTQTNNGFWSVNDSYPVISDSENKAVYKTRTPEGDKYLKAGTTITLSGAVYINVSYNDAYVIINENGDYDITIEERDGEITAEYRYYNITLNTNKGKINSGKITEYSTQYEDSLPTDVTKDGYVFKGWYDNSDCIGEAVTVIPKGSTGDKEYYAKFITIAEYVESFEAITDNDHVITNLETDWINIPADSESNTPAKLQSGEIGVGQESVTKLTVTIPENTSYAFMVDYLVSSEKDCDWFDVYADDAKVVHESGEETIGNYAVKLDAGTHTIILKYAKNSENPATEKVFDMAQVSNLVFEKIDGDVKILSADFNTPKATIFAASEKTATLVFVSFNEDGKLVSTDIQDNKKITVGRNSYTPTEEFKTTGARNMSVMLIENLSTLKPLCDKVTAE